MNEQAIRESEHLWRDEFPHIDANSADPSAGMARERKLATYGEDLWWLGWSDGGSGQPIQTGVDLINTHADSRRRIRLRAARAQCAAAKAKHDAATEIAESLAQNLQDRREELGLVEARRRENPHEISLFTGLAYVAIAVVLLIADMPLSLNLVADAFNMPHTYALSETDILTISELFVGRRGLVLRYLWEPIVLATGIAALGIFFKIMSDYLLSTTPMFVNRPRLLKALKTLFFGGAAILLVLTLMWVGRLRATQHVISRAAEAASGAAEYSIDVGAATTSGGGGSSSGALPPRTSAGADSLTGLATETFIFLGIALPLIGGICFSIGWKRVQQSTRLLFLRASCARLMRQLHRRRLDAATAHADAAVFEHEVEELNTTSESAHVTPEHLYMHGYMRGFSAPQRMEPHRTLYGRCREVLHHWIAAGIQAETLDRIARKGPRP